MELQAACAEFQNAMGDMGGVAEQVLKEYGTDGTLSLSCKWRLFAWCYTSEQRAVPLARKIWSLTLGNLPTQEEAKSKGLKRLS